MNKNFLKEIVKRAVSIIFTEIFILTNICYGLLFPAQEENTSFPILSLPLQDIGKSTESSLSPQFFLATSPQRVTVGDYEALLNESEFPTILEGYQGIKEIDFIPWLGDEMTEILEKGSSDDPNIPLIAYLANLSSIYLSDFLEDEEGNTVVDNYLRSIGFEFYEDYSNDISGLPILNFLEEKFGIDQYEKALVKHLSYGEVFNHDKYIIKLNRDEYIQVDSYFPTDSGGIFYKVNYYNKEEGKLATYLFNYELSSQKINYPLYRIERELDFSRRFPHEQSRGERNYVMSIYAEGEAGAVKLWEIKVEEVQGEGNRALTKNYLGEVKREKVLGLVKDAYGRPLEYKMASWNENGFLTSAFYHKSLSQIEDLGTLQVNFNTGRALIREVKDINYNFTAPDGTDIMFEFVPQLKGSATPGDILSIAEGVNSTNIQKLVELFNGGEYTTLSKSYNFSSSGVNREERKLTNYSLQVIEGEGRLIYREEFVDELNRSRRILNWVYRITGSDEPRVREAVGRAILSKDISSLDDLKLGLEVEARIEEVRGYYENQQYQNKVKDRIITQILKDKKIVKRINYQLRNEENVINEVKKEVYRDEKLLRSELYYVNEKIEGRKYVYAEIDDLEKNKYTILYKNRRIKILRRPPLSFYYMYEVDENKDGEIDAYGLAKFDFEKTIVRPSFEIRKDPTEEDVYNYYEKSYPQAMYRKPFLSKLLEKTGMLEEFIEKISQGEEVDVPNPMKDYAQLAQNLNVDTAVGEFEEIKKQWFRYRKVLANELTIMGLEAEGLFEDGETEDQPGVGTEKFAIRIKGDKNPFAEESWELVKKIKVEVTPPSEGYSAFKLREESPEGQLLSTRVLIAASEEIPILLQEYYTQLNLIANYPDEFKRVDTVVRKLTGYELIYDGLARLRELVHYDSWEAIIKKARYFAYDDVSNTFKLDPELRERDLHYLEAMDKFFKEKDTAGIIENIETIMEATEDRENPNPQAINIDYTEAGIFSEVPAFSAPANDKREQVIFDAKENVLRYGKSLLDIFTAIIGENTDIYPDWSKGEKVTEALAKIREKIGNKFSSWEKNLSDQTPVFNYQIQKFIPSEEGTSFQVAFSINDKDDRFISDELAELRKSSGTISYDAKEDVLDIAFFTQNYSAQITFKQGYIKISYNKGIVILDKAENVINYFPLEFLYQGVKGGPAAERDISESTSEGFWAKLDKFKFLGGIIELYNELKELRDRHNGEVEIFGQTRDVNGDFWFDKEIQKVDEMLNRGSFLNSLIQVFGRIDEHIMTFLNTMLPGFDIVLKFVNFADSYLVFDQKGRGRLTMVNFRKEKLKTPANIETETFKAEEKDAFRRWIEMVLGENIAVDPDKDAIINTLWEIYRWRNTQPWMFYEFLNGKNIEEERNVTNNIVDMFKDANRVWIIRNIELNPAYLNIEAEDNYMGWRIQLLLRPENYQEFFDIRKNVVGIEIIREDGNLVGVKLNLSDGTSKKIRKEEIESELLPNYIRSYLNYRYLLGKNEYSLSFAYPGSGNRNDVVILAIPYRDYFKYLSIPNIFAGEKWFAKEGQLAPDDLKLSLDVGQLAQITALVAVILVDMGIITPGIPDLSGFTIVKFLADLRRAVALRNTAPIPEVMARIAEVMAPIQQFLGYYLLTSLIGASRGALSFNIFTYFMMKNQLGENFSFLDYFNNMGKQFMTGLLYSLIFGLTFNPRILGVDAAPLVTLPTKAIERFGEALGRIFPQIPRTSARITRLGQVLTKIAGLPNKMAELIIGRHPNPSYLRLTSNLRYHLYFYLTEVVMEEEVIPAAISLKFDRESGLSDLDPWPRQLSRLKTFAYARLRDTEVYGSLAELLDPLEDPISLLLIGPEIAQLLFQMPPWRLEGPFEN